MNNEVERYVGELRELREKVKYLEAELAKHKPKVRVSGVPYEVEMIQEPNKPLTIFRKIKREVE
jgi:hypothetical protein